MSENDTKNILLIDDEVDLAEMTAFQLTSLGYHLEVVHDGTEGLEKIKSYTPDLIILDMNMPIMGGLEFYEHILDESGKPRFPILIFSARANIDVVLKKLHVSGHVVKPFEFEDLAQKVKDILSTS